MRKVLSFENLCAFVLLLWASETWMVSAVCPHIQTVPNFDPERFMGKWYEIQKYPNVWEAGQKCITTNYNLNPNGTINVENRGVYKLINYPINIRGLATPNTTDPARFDIEFRRFAGFTGKSKLWILETDYQNYALTYSCSSLPVVPINIENAWIMSRTPTLDQQIVDLLSNRLTAINSPTFLFFRTDQSNCPNDDNNTDGRNP
ncbi:unnamed protein product [Medioppia subpectinata]|uniref:Apolipoprotein D n=1 Tax=Medioppia subpectinata TaxID=1979941 RepID=A0A7R9L827_9ACAR|nr:unnamed protein product [Medioppia subpectinata]CAG2116184.1 unnamed protein product [Medioppia subpectinata]